MKRIILFLIHLCVASVAMQAQFKLSGRVTDEHGEPLAMVTVRVAGQGQSAAATNREGRYQLTFQTADTVKVTFSMIGFQTRTKVLKKPASDQVLSVQMKPVVLDLGEVTVKEIARQLDGTQRLNGESLKRMPSTTGNAVEELVATQAGVSTHNELSSQYNVRGGSFDENSVYINGVEVYRPMLISSGQQEGLSIINSDMVDGINFSSGGFDARYGDKMSSVLDITYKKPKRHEATVSASLLGANVYGGTAWKNFTMTHGLRYKTNQYMLGSLETKGEYHPRFVDYQTYLSWQPLTRWTLDFIGNISQNKYDFIPADRETNFGTAEDVKSFKVYFDGAEHDLFRTLFGTLQLTHNFTKRTHLSLLASAYNTRERETYDIQGQYWLDDTNTSEQLGVGTYLLHARNQIKASVTSLKLDFRHRPKGHDIRAGVGWKHEVIDEVAREWEMRDSAGYSMPHHEDRLELIYNMKSVADISSNRLELYVQDTWRTESRVGVFSLNGGVRLSHWSWNSETLFSPRLCLGFIPSKNENWVLRLSTGLYYQAPFYKELRDTVTAQGGNTYVSLNRDIKSQRSYQVILASDYAFKMWNRNFKFTAEAYYKAQSDINPYTVDNVKIVYRGENCAKGYVVGMDMKLYGEFVPGADSWISFGLMKASQTINGKTVPQPTDQRYNINFYFTDFFPGTDRWKMTLKASFAQGLPFTAPHKGPEYNNFRATPYRRFDLGMNYLLLKDKPWVRNIWLGLDCFNVFDINNVSSYYWVTDVTNQQYAVPNYLTSRQINARVLFEF